MLGSTQEQLELANKKLEESKKECERLQKELADEKRYDKAYENGMSIGKELNAIKKGLIDAGLTESQAWSVVMSQICLAPLQVTRR